MSARKSFYSSVQLQARAYRMNVSRMEDKARFDYDLHKELSKARAALEMVEHQAALGLAGERAAV